MTSFPLLHGRRCLEREEFIARFGAVFFSEAVRAISTSPRLVASRKFPGAYYGLVAQYRDANEGNEEFYEFAKVSGVFKPSRVGNVDMTCEPRTGPTPR
jgi:hypothetical protein